MTKTNGVPSSGQEVHAGSVSMSAYLSEFLQVVYVSYCRSVWRRDKVAPTQLYHELVKKYLLDLSLALNIDFLFRRVGRLDKTVLNRVY